MTKTTLRPGQWLPWIPSVAALVLLGGAGALQRVHGAPVPPSVSKAPDALKTCRRAATLLEQSHPAEAEQLLATLPAPPLSLDRRRGLRRFEDERQVLERLIWALLRAAKQSAAQGQEREAMNRVRSSRALLYLHRSVPELQVLRPQWSAMVEGIEGVCRPGV